MSLCVTPALWMSWQWWIFSCLSGFLFGFCGCMAWFHHSGFNQSLNEWYVTVQNASHIAFISVVIFHVSLGLPVHPWLSSSKLFWQRAFENTWQMYFYGPDDQQFQSSEGNSKQWFWQCMASSQPFFICHRTSVGKAVVPLLHLSNTSILIECTMCLNVLRYPT